MAGSPVSPLAAWMHFWLLSREGGQLSHTEHLIRGKMLPLHRREVCLAERWWHLLSWPCTKRFQGPVERCRRSWAWWGRRVGAEQVGWGDHITEMFDEAVRHPLAISRIRCKELGRKSEVFLQWELQTSNLPVQAGGAQGNLGYM